MILYSVYDCLDFKGCLFLICVLLLLIDLIRNKNPANFPPGPWPLPILGNVFTDVNFKTVDQLIEKYGNIFSVRIGSDKIVYVSGFKMVKDVLITQGENFTDRPVSPLFDTLYKGRGLSFNNGYSWRKHQQFSMSHLKNFGEGRKTLEENNQRECYFLCETFKEEQGRPFDPLVKINNAVANIIGFLVFGHRYEYSDVNFQKRLQMSAESVFLTGSVWNQLYDAFPGIMKWVPGPHQTIISNYQKLANFLEEKIEQHKPDWDISNPRDYIDAYLTEAEKKKNDTEAGFTVGSLVWSMVDLFEGGTETTTNTLRWALLFLIKYPDIQIMAYTAILEILDVKGILLFIAAFLLVADYLKNRNPPKYPPSPLSVPLLGNIFNVDSKEPHLYLTKLGHAYNNIFSLRLGRDKTVFITGYKMVKEALVTQAENFVDRPNSPVLARVYSGNAGLFFSNGEMWKKQRRFALSTLRNFGLGKKTMELAICEESRFLLEEIDGQKGAAFDPTILLYNAVSNIICQMVFGQRFDYADHQFKTMLKYISKSIQLEGSIWGQIYEAFPAIMKHLPGPHNDIFSNYDLLKSFVHEVIVKHKAELDPSEPRDYIDTFLIEMMETPHERVNGFEEPNLVACVLDLFLAGTESTSNTLCWGLIYLVMYPDVQEKVHEEIDRVIGNSREPSIADKANMPYTEAVIHEIMRFGDVIPLNGLRVAARDTTLGECFIPKGTTVLPILHSVLFDENEWETPYKFNPGHFLDKEGKFVRRDAFMPFSAGKRVCLGEQIARIELFLFFVSLFRKSTWME